MDEPGHHAPQEVVAAVNGLRRDLTSWLGATAEDLRGSADEVADLEVELAQLRAEHDQLRAEHDQLRAEHDQLRAEHDELRAAHTALRGRADRVRAELGALQDSARVRFVNALAAPLDRVRELRRG